MKAIVIYLSIILTTSLLYGQSSIVYGSATSLYVGAGSDLCAATITINGTFSGGGTFCNAPVDVETEDKADLETPKEFSLSQNFPNPFNPNTIISFAIPIQEFVTLKVFDILGKQVGVLINENKEPGYYEINFNASELPSGTYIYEIRAGNPSSGTGQSFVQTKKMILIK
jgi:hypothetical protein